jgi:hypothetical protein
MTEHELSQALAGLLADVAVMDTDDLARAGLSNEVESFIDSDVRSFESCGLMTSNEGVVIALADGTEFQLTIVRSK